MRFTFQYLNKLTLSSLILIAFSTAVLATPEMHFYVGGIAGASQGTLNKARPIITYNSGGLTDAFPLNDRTSTAALIGINAGYEFDFACYSRYIPAVGLGLGLYTNAARYHYNGQVIETATGGPSSVLFNYEYNLRSTRLMAELYLTWLAYCFDLFVDGGLGVASHNLSKYRETPADALGFVPLSPFHSRDTSNIAYQIGFGVGYAFNFVDCPYKHERIALAYRYADLGNSSFGIRGATYSHNLKVGRLTSNELYLTYTHLF